MGCKTVITNLKGKKVDSTLLPELEKHYRELGNEALAVEYYELIFPQQFGQGITFFSKFMAKKLNLATDKTFSWKNEAHVEEAIQKGLLNQTTNEPTLKTALELIDEYLASQQYTLEGTTSVLLDAVNVSKKTLDRIIETLEISIVNLSRNVLDPKQLKAEEKDLDKFMSTIRNWINVQPVMGVYEYVNRALKDTTDVKNMVKAKKKAAESGTASVKDMITLSDLDKFRNYIDRYIDIKEVEKLLGEDNPLKLEDDKLQSLQKSVTEVNKNRDYVMKYYKQQGHHLYANLLAPYNKRIVKKHREALEAAWKKNNPENTGKTAKDQMSMWVSEQLKTRDAQIHKEAVKQVKEWLLTWDYDLDIIDVWLKTAKDSPDELLQLYYTRLRDVEDKVERDYWQVYDEGDKLFNAYKKEVFDILSLTTEGNGKKFYSYILEQDKKGKLTQFLVDEYLSTWEEDFKQLEYDVHRLEPAERTRTINEWHNKNSIRTEVVSELGKKRVIWTPNETYKNPQWAQLEKLRAEKADHPIVAYYDWVMDIHQKTDKKSPKKSRLGNRIPGLRSKVFERLRIHDMREWPKIIKGLIWESVFRTNMDTEIGEIGSLEDKYKVGEKLTIQKVLKVDVRRNPVKVVPLHFTEKLRPEEQSYDLNKMILGRYWNASNFYAKMRIMPEVQLGLLTGQEREIQRSDSGISQVMQFFRKKKAVPAMRPGIESGNYEAMLKFYNQFFYGEELKEMKTFLIGKGVDIDLMRGDRFIIDTMSELSLNKFWQKYVNQYYSLVALGFNWLSASANWILGVTLSISDAVGGEFYTPTDWTMATVKFNADMPFILKDAGVKRAKSKTALLMREFSADNRFHEQLNPDYNLANRALMLTNGLPYFMTQAVEFANHAKPMYAYLNRIKVVDKHGKYISYWGIDKEGNKRRGSMTVDEAYKVKFVDGQHRLVLDPRVEGTTWNPKMPPEDRKFKFHHSLKMQDLNEKLHGSYSRNNKKPFQTTLSGASIALLKKFWVIGMFRRWQKKGFRHITGVEEEGMYRSTLAYTFLGFFPNLYNAIKELKFELLTQDWTKLTPHQKSNIKNSITQMAFLIMASYLGTIFRNRGDEESEEDAIDDYLLAFFFLRLSTELAAYHSPAETWKLLKSPAASLTLIERMTNLLDQLGADIYYGEWERYKQGHMKGKPKIRKDIKNVVPFWKHVDRHLTIDDALRFYERNQRKQ